MRYWKRVNDDGNITTMESYSHDQDVDGAIEVTEMEFHEYIALLPPPQVQPIRDLAAEVDQLRVQFTDLDARLRKDIGGHVR